MSFKITIQPSGHVFECEAEETVLEAALRNGYAFSYGCRAGSCGACKGKVVQGEFAYEFDEDPIAISEKDKMTGMSLFCQAQPKSDMELEVKEISAAKDIVVKTLPSRVVKMEKLAPDVMRLFLKLPMVERMQFLAGQYLDVLLKDGRRRSFSIANPPHEDELIELHIRKIEGGFYTQYVFDEMQEKALLRVEGPLGTFFLREDSKKSIILMAGGTGFAPIKAILEHAFSEKLARPMHLYWGARVEEGLYLKELVDTWVGENDNFQFTPVLSDVPSSESWSGRTGLVHEAIVSDHPDLSSFEIYASGPPQMVDAGRVAFCEQGLSEDDYFFDSFTFAND